MNTTGAETCRWISGDQPRFRHGFVPVVRSSMPPAQWSRSPCPSRLRVPCLRTSRCGVTLRIRKPPRNNSLSEREEFNANIHVFPELDRPSR
jgi:hypothetical protein